MKKILVIKLSNADEIILTTPLVRALKTQLEDYEVHYCTRTIFQSMLFANPYVDKIQEFNNSFVTLIRALKKEKFDIVVDLEANAQSKLIKFLLNARTFTYKSLKLEKWLMVNLKINRLPNIHLVDRYMDTVKALDVRKDNLGLDYFIPEKDEVEPLWIPETHRKSYVLFGIMAKYYTRKLPLNKMIELCDRINKPIILIGDKEDAVTGDKIEEFFTSSADSEYHEPGLKRMNKKTIIYNACGIFNVNQIASMIKGAKYVFTHDSFVMQIAASFKKQTFSIWGNTIPLFGKYPYKTKFTLFENNKLHCRPCSENGYSRCPKEHFKCMQDIAFDFYLP